MINIEVFATTRQRLVTKGSRALGASFKLEDFEDYGDFIVAVDKAFEELKVEYNNFEELYFIPKDLSVNGKKLPLYTLHGLIDGSYVDADIFNRIHDEDSSQQFANYLESQVATITKTS